MSPRPSFPCKDPRPPPSSLCCSMDPPPQREEGRNKASSSSSSSFSRVTGRAFLLLILCHSIPITIVQFRSVGLSLRIPGWVLGVAGRRGLLGVDHHDGRQVAFEWSGIRLAPVKPGARLPFTSVHCAGENYSPASWRYRSCEFRNLCLDAANPSEVVALESREERDLRRALQAFSARERETITISTVMDPARSSLSLGTSSAAPWFPRVVAHDGDDGGGGAKESSPRPGAGAGGAPAAPFSALPESVVLVPISVSTASLRSNSNKNVIWDVFYPIYTLLSLFGLEEKQAVLLILDPNDNAESGATRSRMEGVLNATDKSTMILAPSAVATSSGAPTETSRFWVCSKYAVAGLGLRRLDDVSEEEEDAGDRSSRSAAEGINLWAFRTFMMRALRVPQPHDNDTKEIPLRVTVHRSLQQQLGALKRVTPTEQAQIHPLDLRENITTTAKAIAESRVFVTSLEGLGETNLGLVTFLPRDSYLLLLVDNDDTYDARSPYGMRSMEWDLLNAAGYFHVRVLPLRDRDSSILASTLKDIVRYVRSEAS
jgi:hypothetical protein